MKWCVRGVLVGCFLGAIAAMPSDDPGARRSVGDSLVDQIFTACTKKDSLSCFQRKLFAHVDKALDGKDSFSLAEGVQVIKSETGGGAPRSADEKSDDVEVMLLNRFERFLQTHTFLFSVKGSDVLSALSNAANTLGLSPDGGIEEARGKKKKALKFLLPLILALKFKFASLIPFAMAIIVIVAKKALVVGKIALLISLLIGLKKLVGNQQKSVTYEIVSHPHHTSHDVWSGGDYGSSGNGGGHGGGGWGRSSNDAQHMAYKAHQPKSP